MKKYILTVLKIVISLGLLAYLINLADPEKILMTLNQVWYGGGVIYLLAGTSLFVLSLYVLSFRWQVLITAYGLKIETAKLFKFYMIGLFFNNFLPTGIGGDVLRIYNLVQQSGNRTVGFVSVLTERLIGILSTLVLAIIALLVLPEVANREILLLITSGMMFLLIGFFIVAMNEKLSAPLERWSSRISAFRLGERVQKFLDSIRFYADGKTIYLKVLLISTLSQTFIILMTYSLAKAIDLDIDLGFMFLVVPITFLLSMLPSINGIGVRDGGYVVLLAGVGVTKAAALSLSFLTVIIPMLISIYGGILFMIQKRGARHTEVKIDEKIV
ncbi:MAG: flippase-like domain-containing protein [Calditrichales bacterium]|nr:MAG: flippase-like domain-containing protein [Calditrichales bacterium]